MLGWVLQSLTKYYTMKFIVLGGVQKISSTCSLCGALTNYLSICMFHLFHRIISAGLHTFHSAANSFMYMFSVCVHTGTDPHTRGYIQHLFTYILLGESKGFFFCHRLLMEFSCCPLLCNLDSRASRNGEHPRVVQYLYSKYSKYHKYQRSKCLYPNIRLIP